MHFASKLLDYLAEVVRVLLDDPPRFLQPGRLRLLDRLW